MDMFLFFFFGREGMAKSCLYEKIIKNHSKEHFLSASNYVRVIFSEAT